MDTSYRRDYERRGYRGREERWDYDNEPERYARGSRGYGRTEPEDWERDRGMWDRASDEVRTWFGDDEAARRRRMDESYRGRGERGYEGWRGGSEGYRGDRGYEGYRGAGGWEGLRGAGTEGYRGGYEGPGGWEGYRTDEASRGWQPRTSSYRGEGWAGMGDQEPYWRGAWGGMRGGVNGLGQGGRRGEEQGSFGRGQSGRGYERYGGDGGLRHAESRYSEYWSEPGPYSGRGPQGYQRSNEAVREEICQRMEQHGWLDPSECRIRVENGVVVLEGSVGSRREKRIAEDLAEVVSGVHDVRNMLEVRREQSAGSLSSAGSLGSSASAMSREGESGMQSSESSARESSSKRSGRMTTST